MGQALLRVEDLSLSFPSENGRRDILDQVSFEVFPHEVMGLVGESGSGKSLTALAVIGLLPPTARIDGGRVFLDDRELLALPERERRLLRGKQIAMVFQSPRAALNPLMRVGQQVARAVRLHAGLPGREAYAQGLSLLQRVGIADAAARARAYPHQLSGGMAQRVLVAMMLACQPRLLIADEPTTGLDVTIQAQIFELIRDVQVETGAALILITHDLGVVSEVCHRVAVMYAGQVMEVARVEDLFRSPRHPYTELLLRSTLRADRPADLDAVPPQPSVLRAYVTSGCRFPARCSYALPICRERRPSALNVGDGHVVLCHKVAEEGR